MTAAASSTIYDYSTSTTQQRAQAEKEAATSGKVSHTDFLKLLTTQLTTQDPLNPMEDIDFTAQLAQLQALDEQMAMTKSLTALRLDTQIQAGAAMVGKYVSGVDKYGAAAAGQVTRMVQMDGSVYLELANKQQVEISGVSNMWNDSSSMSQEIINSGGIIGMWVEAGYDEAMQPIEGIVEEVIIADGIVRMKLYGGQSITWDQVRTLRAPTDDEVLYTYPDEVREAYQQAYAMVGKTVTGKTDAGETATGMVGNVGISGSDVYVVLYNGDKINLSRLEGGASEPTVGDLAENLGGFWVEGLDGLGKSLAGVVVGADQDDGGLLVVLADGTKLYFDNLTKIREATEEEREAARSGAGGGDPDPAEPQEP